MPLPMDPPHGTPDPRPRPQTPKGNDPKPKRDEGLRDTNQARIDELEKLIQKDLDEIKLLKIKIEEYDNMEFVDPDLKKEQKENLLARIDQLNDRVADLTTRIVAIKTGEEKYSRALTDLDALLENGDIEGAFTLVLTNRALSLDRQLSERLKELNARNEEIKSLNDELARLSGPDKDLNAKQRTKKVKLKGQIDKLNADSQLDMINIQSLINKRHSALEKLTNLLQNFQKLLDSIVANMR